jgi:WD40 repeat protein
MLATVMIGKSLQVWDPSSGHKVFECKVDQGADRLAWSNDGRYIAVGGARGIDIVNIATQKPASDPMTVPHSVAVFGFTPDDRSLVIRIQGGTVEVWDFATRQRVRQMRAILP